MMEPRSLVRIAVRKIPPTVTESDFKALKPISKVLADGRGTVQFYSAEMIGTTAAPASAFAIVTLNDMESGPLIAELEAITFQQPYDTGSGKTYHPLIEFAPIKNLFTNTQVKTKVADIDDDPEFVAFAKNYETGFIPATDAYVSSEEINTPAYDAAKLEALWRNRPSNGKQNGGKGGKKDRRRK